MTEELQINSLTSGDSVTEKIRCDSQALRRKGRQMKNTPIKLKNL